MIKRIDPEAFPAMYARHNLKPIRSITRCGIEALTDRARLTDSERQVLDGHVAALLGDMDSKSRRDHQWMIQELLETTRGNPENNENAG